MPRPAPAPGLDKPLQDEGGTCNCITGLASPDPVTFLASANEYFADDAFTTNHPSPPAADLFTFGGSGLLTIGTLGIAAVAVPTDADDHEYDVDVVDAESDSDDKDDNVDEEDDVDGAVTPTFTCPPPPPAEAAVVVEKAVAAVVEAIAEKDDDTTTEDDLMVVSAELEKVLGGRNSGTASDLVASARVSFAMGVDCPLQGFLFGSPVSDVESRLEQPRDSNGGGRRTSLGELFMRTRFAEEKVALVAVEEGEDGGDATAGGERGDGKSGKEGGGGHKTLKKRVKDGKVAGGEGAPASAAVTKSKFQKILQIFHRKVYPESTALARSLTKKCRKRGSSSGGADEPEPASPKLRCRKEQRAPGFGCCANRASFGGATSPTDDDDDEGLNSSKSGHWIRTDAEYLVLEL
ncbi:protein LAZY 1-like isoform X3 [Panicum virgatum]|uniref:Uncharacterized protein n=1 Tax=Panicum virgatum TaxID=38727 RepID=A0A8T0PEQ3_PANVG|nr:protein LAZY 1-like isoform X3 [Panicum virgatum]KAG2557696.1 hypothetical protein PVAP13_8NG229000 [Panicum virgatum]